jgi:hypothetical protein
MNLKSSIFSGKSLALGAGSIFVSTTAMLGGTGVANAAAIIYNTGDASTATVALGINDQGHLNVTDPTGSARTANGSGGAFGVATKYVNGTTFSDGTAPGCLCEGWGVSGSIAGTNYFGTASASNSPGVSNLTVSSFTTDATAGRGTFARSTTALTSLSGLSITQDYRISAGSSNLFENKVTITNATGSAIDSLRYVRDMDWDIAPTEFSELVTIGGTGTTTQLELSHDNGFASLNPLLATSARTAGTTDVDFVRSGPSDHGAYFKFNFGTLAAGESQTFSIFYGAAANETDALTALGETGIELYSFGQANSVATNPTTYIFGFKGVGGAVVVPDPTPDPTGPVTPPSSAGATDVPEPFTVIGSIIGGTAAFRMRKKLKATK